MTMSSPSGEKDVRGAVETLRSWRMRPWPHNPPLNAVDVVLAALQSAEQRATKLAEEVERLSRWADSFSDAQLKERATGEAYQKELRQRLFGQLRAPRHDHTTACSIWGDDGQGNTHERFRQPLPCNCGALENFQRSRAEATEAQLAGVVEALKRIASLKFANTPGLNVEPSPLDAFNTAQHITRQTLAAINSTAPVGEEPTDEATVNRLAQELDVSPDRVRQGLRTLEDRGLIASLPAQDVGGLEVALSRRAYVTSEKHLSGARITIGFTTLGDAQAAHDAIARLGR